MRREPRYSPRHPLRYIDSPVIRLALAFVAAELLDLVSASPFHELNPAVLGLGTSAPFAKALLIAGVPLVAALLVHSHQRPVAVVLLVAGIAVGLVGAVSNVVAAQ